MCLDFSKYCKIKETKLEMTRKLDDFAIISKIKIYKKNIYYCIRLPVFFSHFVLNVFRISLYCVEKLYLFFLHLRENRKHY